MVDESNTGWFDKLLALDPVVVRGFLASFIGVAAVVVGHAVAPETAQAIIEVVVALLALIASISARSKVTPNDKVVIFKPNLNRDRIVAGPASTNAPADVVVEAARIERAAA